jgi:hypothetical protein
MRDAVDGSSCDQQADAGWIGRRCGRGVSGGLAASSRGMTRAVSVQCGQTAQDGQGHRPRKRWSALLLASGIAPAPPVGRAERKGYP